MDYKKGNFDGLHKQLKNAFGEVFPKKKFPFQAIISKKGNLIAYISSSKMIFEKITEKRNFPKRKLYARKFGKMPEKS